MGAVDDHSGELGKHAALSLVPQSANPDSGTTSGNLVLWTDTSNNFRVKLPNGTEGIVSTSASASGSFAPLTVLTTSALAANTYSSTTQRITYTSTGAITVNGVALVAGMRVGVYGESSSNNGIYDVLTAGATGVALVLQRSADANVSADFVRGKAMSVSAQDTTNGGKFYQISNTGAITLDTTTITVAEQTDMVTLTGTQELTNKTLTGMVVKTGLTATGSAANDFSASTGDFKTSTGALTHAGASGKAAAIGTTAAGLTLSTTTSGTLAINSAGALNGTAAAASTFTVTGANFTLNTATSGTMSVDSAAALTLGPSATSITVGSGSVVASFAGGLSLAAGKSITMTSGAGGIDGSAATGAFKLGTSGATIGFFGATAAGQQTASANAAISAAGSTAANRETTYTGGTGSSAYSVGGLVLALKNLGLIAT